MKNCYKRRLKFNIACTIQCQEHQAWIKEDNTQMWQEAVANKLGR